MLITLSENYEDSVLGKGKSLDGNQNLVTATNDSISNVKVDTAGVVKGLFDDADQGDESGYISVVDSFGNVKSFTLGIGCQVGERVWNDMLDGRYKGKEVNVPWKMKRTYIESIVEYRDFETA